MKNPSQGLRGDARPTDLYALRLPSHTWAVAVADEIVARLKPALDVTVRYAQRPQTSQIANVLLAAGLKGIMVGNWTSSRHGGRIDLYPSGRDFGTLAHELAHAVSGRGHDQAFQLAHSAILDLLESRSIDGMTDT